MLCHDGMAFGMDCGSSVDCEGCNKTSRSIYVWSIVNCSESCRSSHLGPQQSVETMRLQFAHRRDLIVGLANDIAGFKTTIPDGAFYIFQSGSSLGKKNQKMEMK